MIIALVGTPSAGKHTILEYLVAKHDFVRLDLARNVPPAAPASLHTAADLGALSLGEVSRAALCLRLRRLADACSLASRPPSHPPTHCSTTRHVTGSATTLPPPSRHIATSSRSSRGLSFCSLALMGPCGAAMPENARRTRGSRLCPLEILTNASSRQRAHARRLRRRARRAA